MPHLGGGDMVTCLEIRSQLFPWIWHVLSQEEKYVSKNKTKPSILLLSSVFGALGRILETPEEALWLKECCIYTC